MVKIAVLGDAFIDTYHIGNVRGLSAEAPIPIIDIISTTNLPGGAGNVTVNLNDLGADCYYVEKYDQEYPRKNRLMISSGEQLARWDEDDHCKPYDKADLLGLLEADALIVCDYQKGSINEEVIQYLRDVAQAIPVFVDTKGDPSPWIGSEVTMFPNMAEYKRYEEKYNWFPCVVLKRGEDGIAFLEFGHVVYQRPSFASTVRSVNGAGDTVIAAFALAACANLGLADCVDFANAAAGQVVSQHFLQRTTNREAVLDMLFGPEKDQYENFRDGSECEARANGSGTRITIQFGCPDVGRPSSYRNPSESYRSTSKNGNPNSAVLAIAGPAVDEVWKDTLN